MTKTKLNFNQMIALTILLIGIVFMSYFSPSPGLVFMFLGISIFLISSKINLGIIISFVLINIGAILKVIHHFGGNPIILIGIIGLISAGIFEFYKKKYPINLLSILIALSSILIGISFKILHLPYSNQVMLFGVLTLFISYSYRFYTKHTKVWEDYLKLMIVLFWCATYLATVLHLTWSSLVSTAFQLSFLLWLILSFGREFKIIKTT
jgi:hypothetical protein